MIKQKIGVERDELGKKIMEFIQGYSYNTCEICRAMNGLNPFHFKGCFFKFDKNRRGPQCREKERGCKINISLCRYRLKKMQKLKMIKSVKMTWFDGREGNEHIPTDIFRFWYFEKEHLARKLIRDVQTHLDYQPLPALVNI